MILLVETNFVLELAFLHEGHEHCDAIVELVKERSGELELAIRTVSMGEAYYRLIGRENSRRVIQKGVVDQFNELSRTRTYDERSEALRRDVAGFLEESDREDRKRLESNLRMLLSVASVIPLDATVVTDAFDLQRSGGLSPPDRWSTPRSSRTLGRGPLPLRVAKRRTASSRATTTSRMRT